MSKNKFPQSILQPVLVAILFTTMYNLLKAQTYVLFVMHKALQWQDPSNN